MISRMENRGRTAVAGCLLLLMVDSTLESHVNVAPYLCMPELINCRNFGLDWGPRSQGRLKT